MKIIISPAKTFTKSSVEQHNHSLPIFHSQSKILEDLVSNLSIEEFKQVYKINNSKLQQYHYYNSSENPENLLAIYSFSGIQYKYLAYNTLNQSQKDFINENTLILSSLYGIIKPLNIIKEHKIDFNNNLNLYEFWEPYIKDFFISNEDKYLILSSNEYTKLVEKHLKSENYLKVKFVESHGGKLLAKSTMSKIQRGKMLRWIAQNNLTDFEQIKSYRLDGFIFLKHENNEIVFIKEK
ncbi:YaaA family protein [Mycoplasma anatis]|uniref:UPF0246 protein MADP07_00371 n=1 Tax=Mycoplasmopsis anatis TaxID=171279 RepID=A0A9Q3L7E3_9BACT|nr:YaaA family protein [Mycoplasmopsis anatis]MBW0595818.1 YaaA family protein [Mycoplasmopsis anatis]MBW0596722.1 YaaA family protein [Mycoplasmopsis anatis]MBW0600117.1 YaaA family protein [Mycoplasmopsis anatis]MBW0602648.1 YaaA family protein [Mycoplasmopsis anatis]MBW0604053.1 YaaA family protein [Mycoplasmopsis anatis]